MSKSVFVNQIIKNFLTPYLLGTALKKLSNLTWSETIQFDSYSDQKHMVGMKRSFFSLKTELGPRLSGQQLITTGRANLIMYLLTFIPFENDIQLT